MARVFQKFFTNSTSLSQGLKALALESVPRLERSSHKLCSAGILTTSSLRNFSTNNSNSSSRVLLAKSTPSLSNPIVLEDEAIPKVEFSDEYGKLFILRLKLEKLMKYLPLQYLMFCNILFCDRGNDSYNN